MKKVFFVILFAGLCFNVMACSANGIDSGVIHHTNSPYSAPEEPEPAQTLKPTQTPTPEPAQSSKTTQTPTPEPTQTSKPTQTPTPEPTQSSKPTQTPTPEPTQTLKPTISPAPTGQSEGEVSITSLTSPIVRNSMATVEIKGTPGTSYNISVFYSSGESTAEGLEPKTSDDEGRVSWTWKVGGRTKPGNYKISILGADGTSIYTFFTVLEE